MKWLEIGTYSFAQNNKLDIVLHEGYEKALTKLDMFSHCLLFFLLKDSINVVVAKIENVDDKRGELLLSPMPTQTDDIEEKKAAKIVAKGQLIDIKPYFPNEEVIKDAKEQERRFLTKYEGNTIGEYKVKGHSSHIQMESDSSIYSQISEGDYLRIIWWFHRFDKDSFRKNRMCNPPYNKAPRSGIFATRSPVRPNPIASTLVKVTGVNVENQRIEINGFDGFPGSKILQVMSYSPVHERVESVEMPPWVSHWTRYKSFEAPKKIDSKKFRKKSV